MMGKGRLFCHGVKVQAPTGVAAKLRVGNVVPKPYTLNSQR